MESRVVEKRKLAEWTQRKRQRKAKRTEDLLRRLDQVGADSGQSSRGRHFTVSIALPGSILNNAQTFELRCYLAGQVARSAAVFCVDEVIVFDETARMTSDECERIDRGVHLPGNCHALMVKILRYLECPQYLRKYLFPLSPDLKCAGLLNPLCAAHHLDSKGDATFPFREGVVLKKPVKKGRGSLCFAGLEKEVEINKTLIPGTRVTMEFTDTSADRRRWKANVVNPEKPVQQTGCYWGYSVRVAKSLKAALSESPYGCDYDLLIGTSDKGVNVEGIEFPEFKHALIVFGGLDGLEAAVENDEQIKSNDPRPLFHHYVNVCPIQGCRSIRTEEAILIALSALSPKLRHRR